jgi:hypothetical protein
VTTHYEARQAAAAAYAEKVEAKRKKPRWICEVARCEYAKVDEHHCAAHRGRAVEPPKAPRHWIPHQKTVPAGMLWCTGCKAAHAPEDFALARNTTRGRQTSCRAHTKRMREAANVAG